MKSALARYFANVEAAIAKLETFTAETPEGPTSHDLTA
jgi:hypothetical protein